MKTRALLLLLLAVIFQCRAQTQYNLDSLKTVVEKMDDTDSSKVHILNQIAWDVSYINLDSGLVIANRSVTLARNLGYKKGEAEALNVLGTIYADMGRYEQAIDAHFQSIRLRDEARPDKLGESYHNLALVYLSMDSVETSLAYQRKAYEYYSVAKDSSGIGPVANYIGEAYLEMDSIDAAIRYFTQGARIARTYGFVHWEAANLGGLAYCTALQGDFKKANVLMQESFDLVEGEKNEYDMMDAWVKMAKLRKLEKNYPAAIAAVDSALAISTKLNVRDSRMEHLHILAGLHELNGNNELALEYYREHQLLKDSILSTKNQQNIHNLEAVYENEKQEKALDLLREDDRLQKIFVAGGIVFSIGFVVVAFLLFGRIRMGKIAGLQLQEKKAIIESKNKDITDSITYARRIQDAVTPVEDQLKAMFPVSFVFNRPRSIVSGDFWWTTETDDDYFVALGDCSGHGVPGGFMSLMAASSLNGIVIENKIHSPEKILYELNNKVRAALQHSGTEENVPLVSDTIDIAICKISKKKDSLSCASAGMPVIIARKNRVIEYRGNDIPAGAAPLPGNNPYTLTTVPLQPGDELFLFSDGIHAFAQTGSGSQTLNELLLALNNTHSSALELLEEYIRKHKASREQPDDILVIGLRIA
ncbi:MAG TPA: SpoIIE family protein phosphatase [Bacteroidia bacterium]|nr:SpoIIE family protein phosphatase [Bacteroidia bacterium]